MTAVSARLLALCAAWALALGCVPARTSHAGTSAPFQMITRASNIIVWQRFDPWLMITEDLAEGRVCYFYDYTYQSRLNLKTPQPGDWVPLGSAIKWLLFVETYQGRGRLMTHQVDYHMDFVAWPSDRSQVGCAMSGNICYFSEYRESMVGDHYPVDIYGLDVASGLRTPLRISDSDKNQFAHDGSLLVYRAHLGPGDDRIFGQYLSGGDEFEIAARSGIEPSVCDSLVAWAEVNGSGYDIAAKDILTGEVRTIAHTTADPPCPEAGRGSVFWRDARNAAATGTDIYGYDWQTRSEFLVTNAPGDQSRLRVCDDLATWVSGQSPFQVLWGAFVEPPVKVDDLRVSLVTPDSARLAWTSVGSADDPPVSYDLRTRQDGPISEQNWNTSLPVPGLGAPRPPGEAETLDVQPLNPGYHHFALKVTLQDGSSSLLSNCVCAYVSDGVSALNADLGSYVSFTGVVTGISADGAFYCQVPGSVKAVRVEPEPGEAVAAGELVTATGVLSTDAEFFGPVLAQASLTHGPGSGAVMCLGMCNRSVGGYDARFGGVAEGWGASSLWSLVRIWGRVSGLVLGDGCSFDISDGSLPEGTALHVVSPYPAPAGLADGSYVTVQGVSKVSRASGRHIEIVRPDAINVADF